MFGVNEKESKAIFPSNLLIIISLLYSWVEDTIDNSALNQLIARFAYEKMYTHLRDVDKRFLMYNNCSKIISNNWGI